eukprot:353299-Chlamydomonas_euryale.AAC.5
MPCFAMHALPPHACARADSEPHASTQRAWSRINQQPGASTHARSPEFATATDARRQRGRDGALPVSWWRC